MCVDPSGHKIAFCDNSTEEQILQYNRAIEYLKKSSTAAALIKKLEEAEEIYTIVFIKGKYSKFSNIDNTIHFNPYIGHRMADGYSVQSAAITLAHEMGHAAYKLDNPLDFKKRLESRDVEYLEEKNLELYETPIAEELGEPTRTLDDRIKAVKRNNSTHFTTGYQVIEVQKINLILFSIPIKRKKTYLTEHNEY